MYTRIVLILIISLQNTTDKRLNDRIRKYFIQTIRSFLKQLKFIGKAVLIILENRISHVDNKEHFHQSNRFRKQIYKQIK